MYRAEHDPAHPMLERSLQEAPLLIEALARDAEKDFAVTGAELVLDLHEELVEHRVGQVAEADRDEVALGSAQVGGGAVVDVSEPHCGLAHRLGRGGRNPGMSAQRKRDGGHR